MAFPYEAPIDPAAVDIKAGRVAAVVLRYQQQQVSGAFPGGQLVLQGHGSLALNLSAGTARGFRTDDPDPPVAVEPETPFPALSSGKPLVALAIAMWVKSFCRSITLLPCAHLAAQAACGIVEWKPRASSGA